MLLVDSWGWRLYHIPASEVWRENVPPVEEHWLFVQTNGQSSQDFEMVPFTGIIIWNPATVSVLEAEMWGPRSAETPTWDKLRRMADTAIPR